MQNGQSFDTGDAKQHVGECSYCPYIKGQKWEMNNGKDGWDVYVAGTGRRANGASGPRPLEDAKKDLHKEMCDTYRHHSSCKQFYPENEVCKMSSCIKNIEDSMTNGQNKDTNFISVPECGSCPYIKTTLNGGKWTVAFGGVEVAKDASADEAKKNLRSRFCANYNDTTSAECKPTAAPAQAAQAAQTGGCAIDGCLATVGTMMDGQNGKPDNLNMEFSTTQACASCPNISAQYFGKDRWDMFVSGKKITDNAKPLGEAKNLTINEFCKANNNATGGLCAGRGTNNPSPAPTPQPAPTPTPEPAPQPVRAVLNDTPSQPPPSQPPPAQGQNPNCQTVRCLQRVGAEFNHDKNFIIRGQECDGCPDIVGENWGVLRTPIEDVWDAVIGGQKVANQMKREDAKNAVIGSLCSQTSDRPSWICKREGSASTPATSSIQRND
jgi:hypothetical protein